MKKKMRDHHPHQNPPKIKLFKMHNIQMKLVLKLKNGLSPFLNLQKWHWSFLK
ncbi:hypothetical protein Gotur_033115 [Gossypium turneri]